MKKLTCYQKVIRRMLVNVKKSVQAKNVGERITEEFEIDPL
ncbi:hypothetical protein ACYKY7_001831 [Enterococcus faecalis]|nr:hypothetical protein HMPREF9520_03044 [Enterococcus faecalis TX1467]